MHIAIDAREWSSTTGRYISTLVKELEKADDEHDYSILLHPDDMDKWEPSNPRFSRVPCPHKEFTFDEQLGFKRQLDLLRPDLMHFGMVQQPVWYRGKVVTTINDLTTARFKNPSKNQIALAFKQQVYKWVNKRVARKSAALITYTQFVKDDIVQFAHIDPEKVRVIYLAGTKIAEQAESIPGLENNTFLMYTGRPMPHKNLPRLIEAFALLKESYPKLRLVLAGKKDVLYEQIERDVASKNIPNVLFTGFISDGQLRWLYEHCQAYIVPSLSEGFGMPGLEAMEHGAPVVSSNATCLPEVYGDAAIYFDPWDVQDMAQKIGHVLDDTTLQQKLKTAGHAQAGKYSWSHTATQTLALYNTLLADKK